MFVLQSTKENIKAKVLRTNMKLTEFTIFAVNTTDDFLFSRNMQLIHSIHIPRLYCNVRFWWFIAIPTGNHKIDAFPLT